MLLTQKFHSLNEIDPEFIGALEHLTHEDWPDFNAWKLAEQNSPIDDTFTYWLFFGPTQNTPVGVTQVRLRKLNPEKTNPWWLKLGKFFGAKPVDHRMAVWELGSGGEGPAVFDARFSKSGREKFWQLYLEVEQRPEVLVESIILPQGWGAPKPVWPELVQDVREVWQALRPLDKKHKLYQDYLGFLDARSEIQTEWRKLHEKGIKLGDFPTLGSREELKSECPSADLSQFERFPGGLLTFQFEGKFLGAVHYQKGQAGTWFFEPIPLETQGEELVSDRLYVQYALLKWHEILEARKLVICRHARPLQLKVAAEVQFFVAQGFTTRPMEELTWSRAADVL